VARETASPPREEIIEGEAILAGIVLWDNGAPAEGAEWEVETGSYRREGLTDAEGRFRAEGLNPGGKYRLKVDMAGQRHKEYHQPQDGLRITFSRPATVSGKLLYAGSRVPVQRATVLILNGSRMNDTGANLDEDGAFSVTLVPEGKAVAIAIAGPEFATIVTEEFTPRAGSEIDLGVIEAQAGFEVTGTVLTSSGEPAPFVNVQASPVWRGELPPSGGLRGGWGDVWHGKRGTVADSAGQFTLQHLSAGIHHLSVEGPGYAPKTQEFDIQPGAPIQLTVSPAEGGGSGQ
jgi:hypothetical protein